MMCTYFVKITLEILEKNFEILQIWVWNNNKKLKNM